MDHNDVRQKMQEKADKVAVDLQDLWTAAFYEGVRQGFSLAADSVDLGARNWLDPNLPNPPESKIVRCISMALTGMAKTLRLQALQIEDPAPSGDKE